MISILLTKCRIAYPCRFKIGITEGRRIILPLSLVTMAEQEERCGTACSNFSFVCKDFDLFGQGTLESWDIQLIYGTNSTKSQNNYQGFQQGF